MENEIKEKKNNSENTSKIEKTSNLKKSGHKRKHSELVTENDYIRQNNKNPHSPRKRSKAREDSVKGRNPENKKKSTFEEDEQNRDNFDKQMEESKEVEKKEDKKGRTVATKGPGFGRGNFKSINNLKYY